MKFSEDYELEDFASDDGFINWCLQPDESSDKFWENWIESHPEYRDIIKEAKQLVLDLHFVETEENETAFEHEIWEKIDQHISKSPQRSTLRTFYWLSATAASIVLLLASYFLFPNISPFQNNKQSVEVEWINFENVSGIEKTIKLADGSTVTLEPFSTLKYPSIFIEDQRAVFLQGEAFFDVARDTLKPFMVFANETVTKVLGTSFRVVAFEGEKTVKVDVKTGKVAVYANVSSSTSARKKKQLLINTDEKILVPLPNKKIEVTPNQRVVFDKKKESMIKTLTEEPQIITKIEDLPQFEFEEESVIKVFEALELAYGIDLEYDENELKYCTITTKLRNEPLFQKLNIICTALDLEISEQDAIISIKGGGC